MASTCTYVNLWLLWQLQFFALFAGFARGKLGGDQELQSVSRKAAKRRMIYAEHLAA